MLWLVLTILLNISSALADQTPATHWTRQFQDGSAVYLSVFPENDLWRLLLLQEKQHLLPEVLKLEDFSNQSDAFLAAQPYFKKYQLKKRSLAPLSQTDFPSTTEVKNNRLWPVTQSWSTEWEKLYAIWITENVQESFFSDRNIRTDCADVAFLLRWIFARNNGLPAANRLSGSGLLFTQDSFKKEWLKLPADPLWYKDQRFLAALNYLTNLAYTHTLLGDSYPIAITTDTLTPGTHHLEVRTHSGHTMVVAKTDYSPTSLSPIELLSSTTPRIVRTLFRTGYWYTDQPTALTGGFQKMRWPIHTASGWILKKAENHPGFSKEQYDRTWIQDHTPFAQAILLKLSPNLDFRERLKGGLQDLAATFKARDEVVSQGFLICGLNPIECSETSRAYDEWSTFARDARINGLIEQLEKMVKAMSHSFSELPKIWEDGLQNTQVSLKDSAKASAHTLGELVILWKLKVYVSDPRVSIVERWGVNASSAAAGVGRNLEALLSKRHSRILKQGDQCNSSGTCPTHLDAWTMWNTYDIEEELMHLSGALSQLMGLNPALKEVAQRSSVGASIQREAPMQDWLNRIPWLISDPTVPLEKRWGENRTRYAHTYFEMPGKVSVSASTFAFSPQTPGKIVHLPTQHEVTAPAGMGWQAVDLKSDWAVAQQTENGSAIRIFDLRDLSVMELPPLEIPTRAKVSWISSKILSIQNMDISTERLVDFNQLPVSVSEELPTAPPAMRSVSTIPKTRIAWILTGSPTKQILIYYEDGKTALIPLRDLPSGHQFTSVGGIGGHHLFGILGTCRDAECTARTFAGRGAVDLQSGQVKLLGDSAHHYYAAAGGRAAVYSSDIQPKSCDWVELDEELREIKRTSLGSSFQYSQWSSWDALDPYLVFLTGERQEGGASHENLYRAIGRNQEVQLERFAFQKDESRVVTTNGEWLALATDRQINRVRRWHNPTSVFETRNYINSIQHRQEQPDDLLAIELFNDAVDRRAYYLKDENDEPSFPLISAGPGTQLEVTSQGMIVSFGTHQKIWIDR